MTPNAPPYPQPTVSPTGPAPAIGFSPSRDAERFADEAAAALDRLRAAREIDRSSPVHRSAARLVRTPPHASPEPFLAWIERSCGEATLAALSAAAREMASSRFALIHARGRITFDVVQEVAQPLWLDLFAAWAGLPDQQRRRLRHLAPAVSARCAPGEPAADRPPGLTAALDELRRMFGQAYRHPRYTPSLPNLFSSLETGWSARLGPIVEETTAAALLLMMTGTRAASALTGPVLDRLASQPALAARLRAEPDTTRGFVADFQTALEHRGARFDAGRTDERDTFAPLSRALARMLATAVVESMMASFERVARAERDAPLQHLVLRAGR